MNKKGLIGTYSYSIIASANNITAGIVAYMMLTYSEVSSTTVAMVMTIPAITGTLFAFMSGKVINHFGTKKVAIGLEILELLSGMIYFLFGNKTSVAVLWIAAALYGFMMGGSGVLLGQLINENIEDKRDTSTYIGYSNSIMSLGGVFFASVGGIIAAKDGGANWQRAYLLYGLIVVAIIVGLICLPNNTNDKEIVEENKQKSNDKLPLSVYLMSLHYGLYFMILYTFSLNVSEYVIVTHNLGTSAEAGNAISFITIGGIVAGLTYRMYSNILTNKTVFTMVLLTAVGLGIIYFAPNVVAMYIASFIIGFAMYGVGPYIMAKMSRITTKEGYPQALSIFSGFTNVGLLISLYVFNFLSNIVYGNPGNVDGKIFIAMIGTAILALLAIPLYKNND